MKKQKPVRRIRLVRPFRPAPLVITARGPINAKEIEDFKRKWIEAQGEPAPLLVFCEDESAKVEQLRPRRSLFNDKVSRLLDKRLTPAFNRALFRQ